jgi:hypothetical protein
MVLRTFKSFCNLLSARSMIRQRHLLCFKAAELQNIGRNAFE